ncbi:MAG: PrsW family intramembrane metalloprotease [Candidatus Diapherotrites archaeon]|jgi:RsiW-degrading membrane proteinase PrsW (M82 family)|uniref:PrsW family intramembrane metalloprotease n=1 Tax=Candidatus Iainarchaeum sp. TaxID=3101447 RepID=A0A8T5GGB2_9ARCH|nr:PrsW family intramembrane metalloprotease [Candidatus Diapherotrites archaeon]MBT7241740.1 PrsW family intramembrane metalloprotease [Candidatus Diapherotrites archaeon]
MKKAIILAIILILLFNFTFSEEIFNDSVDIRFQNICSDHFCEDITTNQVDFEISPFEEVKIYGTFKNRSESKSHFTILNNNKLVYDENVGAGKEIKFDFVVQKGILIGEGISKERIVKKEININFIPVDKHTTSDFQTLLLISLIFFIIAAAVGILIRNKFSGKQREEYKYKKQIKIMGSVFSAIFILFIWLAFATRIPPEGIMAAVLLNFGFAIILFSFFYFISQKMIEQKKNSAFLTAGLVAAAISFFVNTSIHYALGINFVTEFGSAIGVAPIVEEAAKGLLLIILLLLFKIKSPRKGFFFGAIVGLGFAVLENVFYSVNYFTFNSTLIIEQLSLIIFRTILPAHMFFTGMTGLLFLLFSQRIKNKPICIFASLGLGIVMHSIFNLFASVFPYILFFLVALLIAGLYVFARVDLNSLEI